MSCKPGDGLVNDGVLVHLLLKVAHLAGSILEGQDGDAHGLFVGHDVETLDDEIGMGRYKELDASIGKAQDGVEQATDERRVEVRFYLVDEDDGLVVKIVIAKKKVEDREFLDTL